MITVSKGVLKAKMLEYFRQIERTGEELIVTDKHVPVLKVTPIREKHDPSEIFADMRKKFRAAKEDVLASTEDEWSET